MIEVIRLLVLVGFGAALAFVLILVLRELDRAAAHVLRTLGAIIITVAVLVAALTVVSEVLP